VEHADTPTARHAPVISAAIARAIYQRGLGLGPEQWSEFAVSTEGGEPIRLVVGNGSDGVVEVICPNPILREQLGALVGFRVVAAGIADGGTQ
jgi:hypothetical protein